MDCPDGGEYPDGTSVILNRAVSVDWCILYANWMTSQFGDVETSRSILVNSSGSNILLIVFKFDIGWQFSVSCWFNLFYLRSGVTCAILNLDRKMAFWNDQWHRSDQSLLQAGTWTSKCHQKGWSDCSGSNCWPSRADVITLLICWTSFTKNTANDEQKELLSTGVVVVTWWPVYWRPLTPDHSWRLSWPASWCVYVIAMFVSWRADQ